jgi:phage terminase large subunit-like protein
VCAADIVQFIEAYLHVPEGMHVGKPLRLEDWQKDIIRLIYDNPAGTRRAIISMPRKQAKSSLAACLLLAHLCGPLARWRPNSQLYSAAQSRDQAAILFALAAKMVRLSPELASAVKIHESAKSLSCPELGTKYRALSAETATAYGLSPSFIVHDELGRVRGPRSPLYEALETAVGAQIDPLSIVISTQAPTDNDLLSILIDDALRGVDPRVVLKLYTAPPEMDPFDEATIRLANPAFGSFLNPVEILAMAEDARRMPARESEFRNLVLNQRIEASSPFITKSVWDTCGAEPIDISGRDVYAGLDLSEVADLTALVLAHVDPLTGVWHLKPTFWLPEEHLMEKAARDRVPWDLWRAEGYLETTPGGSISYEWIASRLREIFEEHHVVKLGFDRWQWAHLRPWLIRAGFGEQQLKATFVEMGQGFKSMSPALRDLEALILDRKIRHGNHPIMTMCFANAVIERDPAGNRKLTKRKSSGRIDGAVALAMAVGVAPVAAAAAATFDVEALIG